MNGLLLGTEQLKPGLNNDGVLLQKPWNLGKPLEAMVGLTEAPTISITQSGGLVFNMRVKVSVISTAKTPSNVFSVSAVTHTDPKS